MANNKTQKLKSEVCENNEDVIFWKWKEIFLRWFSISLNKYFKTHENNELVIIDYEQIILKLQNNLKITVSEFKIMESIINDKKFFSIAKKVFEEVLIVSSSIKDINNFIEKITPESLKTDLIRYLYENVIKYTVVVCLESQEKEQIWFEYENNDIEIYFKNDKIPVYTLKNKQTKEINYFYRIDLTYLEKYWFILARNKKWNILLSKNWTILSENDFDISFLEKTWLVIVKKNKNDILLFRNWLQINDKKTTYIGYDLSYYQETWFIVAKEVNWRVILWSDWKKISEKLKYYTHIDLKNLSKTWLITVWDNKWIYILNKDLSLYSQENKYYRWLNLDYLDSLWVIIEITSDWFNILTKDLKHILYKWNKPLIYDEKKKDLFQIWIFNRKNYLKISKLPAKYYK